jgi:hypothetical protein
MVVLPKDGSDHELHSQGHLSAEEAAAVGSRSTIEEERVRLQVDHVQDIKWKLSATTLTRSIMRLHWKPREGALTCQRVASVIMLG